jgi:hypothetical protein
MGGLTRDLGGGGGVEGHINATSMLHWDLNTLISELSPQYESVYRGAGPGPDTQARVRGCPLFMTF